ncbi:MAG: hypothetical protein AAF639_41180 [Chloroflexota bacterium]
MTALFPDIDIQKTLETLVETNRLLREDIALIQKRLDRLEDDMAEVKRDIAVLKTDVAELKTDVAELKLGMGDLQSSVAKLKGDNYENQVLNKMDSIFGFVLRRGRKARNEISDHLDEAEESGVISEHESEQVHSSDILWQGISKKTKQPLFLVGETSWLAELHDVERAVKRTQIAQRAGLQAVSMVAGQKWTQEAIEAAQAHNVVRVREFSIDKGSWAAAGSQ